MIEIWQCLFKGIAIGILFGVPVGAVGTLTVQRTCNRGVRAGLLTGLGSSVADCIYAVIGAFGFTMISDWLLNYQKVIMTVGGVLICYMGIHAWRKKTVLAKEKGPLLGMFVSSFLVGITNPAAILTFLFAFSYFGLSDLDTVGRGLALVLGVFAGTFVWWSILTFGTRALLHKRKIENMTGMNRIFGSILILFGGVILLRVIL